MFPDTEEPIIVTPAQAEAVAQLVSAARGALAWFERNTRGQSKAAKALRAALIAIGATESEDPR